MSAYKGLPKKFLGQRIEKDSRLDTVNISKQLQVPYISSSTPPPPFVTSQGGGLGYDVSTKTLWYSDGSSWKPVSAALPTGTVQNYSFLAGLSQNILANTITVLNTWSVAGPPNVYNTLPQWNLGSGVYTATQNETLYIATSVCWGGGITNLGIRNLRIEYQASGSGIWQIASQTTRQAEPDENFASCQNCEMSLLLDPGDQVRVTVFHTAPLTLQISSGSPTSASGLRVGA